MRQNAEQIRALAGFKCFISVIKYQELMPDPFDRPLYLEVLVVLTQIPESHPSFRPFQIL